MYHFLQVSTTSSKTDLSESSKQKSVYLGLRHVCSTETPSLANSSNTLFMKRLEFPIPSTSDISTAQSEITLTNQCSSPQGNDDELFFPKHNEDPGLAKPSSVIPDSVCQTAQDEDDEQITLSSECPSTPQGSGSPQLDQLLSDLEEIKPRFKPETLDLPLSESSDGSPEVDQMYKFEDLSPEDQCPTEHSNTVVVSVSSVIQLAEDNNCRNVSVTESSHSQTSFQDDPEVVLGTPNMPKTSDTSAQGRHTESAIFPTESFLIPETPQGFDKDDLSPVMEPSLDSSFPSDMFQSDKYDDNPSEMFSLEFFPKEVGKSLSGKPVKHFCAKGLTTDVTQNQKEDDLIQLSNGSKSVTETVSTQRFDEPEDSSSLYLPHFTETVKVARHFSFEQLMPYPSSGNLESFLDEDRPRVSGHNSEESLTPVDYKDFASQPSSVEHKEEITSSTSDEECSIPPGYTECLSTKNAYTSVTTGQAEVLHSGTDSPTFEYSDPESYFDCKQAASDFSETEPDEHETKTRSVRDQFQDHLSHPRVLEKINQRVLLSSGSEDYEDATFVYEPLHNVHEETKELQQDSETSDEEFTLCEASQPPPVYTFWAYGDTDKPLTRVR